MLIDRSDISVCRDCKGYLAITYNSPREGRYRFGGLESTNLSLLIALVSTKIWPSQDEQLSARSNRLIDHSDFHRSQDFVQRLHIYEFDS